MLSIVFAINEQRQSNIDSILINHIFWRNIHLFLTWYHTNETQKRPTIMIHDQYVNETEREETTIFK